MRGFQRYVSVRP